MDEQDNKVTYFAETDFRNARTKFGIKAKDRTRHMYVIGKTGMGKSTLLENLAIQDIQNDESVVFIDPHGSAAVKLLEYVPKHRIDDVIYLAPQDTDFPVAFNVLENVPKDKRNSVASGLMNAFKKIWVDAWSSRMEYLLNYTLLALLDVPDTTLLSINRLLSDKDYRKHIIDRVEDPIVKNFWNNEFTKYNDKYATEAVAPIQNKVGQFISNPMIRNIVGQKDSSIDFRKVMDEKKILIINLSKGLIGPENMRLLGGMIVTKIYLAAMSRADMPEEVIKRMPTCYLYVDEFQNFANESFAEILSESRKYKLALTVANQYIEQMTEEVRAAIFGNVGSLISFRVGSGDAEVMEKEFAPNFLAEDMVNLGFTQCYMKLMIDGIGSKPFSASSLPPIVRPGTSYIADIVGYSREHYARARPEVDEFINSWMARSFSEPKETREAKEPKRLEVDPTFRPYQPKQDQPRPASQLSPAVKAEVKKDTPEVAVSAVVHDQGIQKNTQKEISEIKQKPAPAREPQAAQPKKFQEKSKEEEKKGTSLKDLITQAQAEYEHKKKADRPKKDTGSGIRELVDIAKSEPVLKPIKKQDINHRLSAKIKSQVAHVSADHVEVEESPEDILKALLSFDTND